MSGKLLNAETRAAEAIVRVLEEAGIDMVFGIAGGNIMASLLVPSAPSPPRRVSRPTSLDCRVIGTITGRSFPVLPGKGAPCRRRP
jgi:hypothetical protein